tara:strand:- start:228 stop:332 length:105 start_codon:yes stop_codon:yes gene_type:complete
MPEKQVDWENDEIQKFNEEPVYLQKDIAEVYTNE